MTKEEVLQIKRNTFFELVADLEDQARNIRLEENEQRKKELSYRFSTYCGEWVERLPSRVNNGIISEVEKEVFLNRTIELAGQAGLSVTDDAYGKGIRFFNVLDLSNLDI